MRTTDPAALCKSILPALPLLLLLFGCAVDEDAPPEDTTPVVEEVLSPVHDIRVAEWDLWSGMATTAEVFLAPENREGWTFSWRVGGGEIVGSGREVVWTTPLADSC